ncbi:hypothetical protein PIB30_020852 [Stylosanthes scabra]|uniref:Uncharacterized protein n=1 Tax=Stylosanthes scabra TaxID=79078 RepID=A0ABU6VB09_9FABA|nr:hypothetical protein [Stylosanthes scabra]
MASMGSHHSLTILARIKDQAKKVEDQTKRRKLKRLKIKLKEERFNGIMKRSHPNLNHPLLYKQGAKPPQGTHSLNPNLPYYSRIFITLILGILVLLSHHIDHLLRIKPSDSSVRFPSEETLSLSLILIVYSLSRLRSIGSLFGTFVLNIGAVCGD